MATSSADGTTWTTTAAGAPDLGSAAGPAQPSTQAAPPTLQSVQGGESLLAQAEVAVSPTSSAPASPASGTAGHVGLEEQGGTMPDWFTSELLTQKILPLLARRDLFAASAVSKVWKAAASPLRTDLMRNIAQARAQEVQGWSSAQTRSYIDTEKFRAHLDLLEYLPPNSGHRSVLLGWLADGLPHLPKEAIEQAYRQLFVVLCRLPTEQRGMPIDSLRGSLPLAAKHFDQGKDLESAAAWLVSEARTMSATALEPQQKIDLLHAFSEQAGEKLNRMIIDAAFGEEKNAKQPRSKIEAYMRQVLACPELSGSCKCVALKATPRKYPEEERHALAGAVLQELPRYTINDGGREYCAFFDLGAIDSLLWNPCVELLATYMRIVLDADLEDGEKLHILLPVFPTRSGRRHMKAAVKLYRSLIESSQLSDFCKARLRNLVDY